MRNRGCLLVVVMHTAAPTQTHMHTASVCTSRVCEPRVCKRVATDRRGCTTTPLNRDLDPGPGPNPNSPPRLHHQTTPLMECWEVARRRGLRAGKRERVEDLRGIGGHR